MGVFEGLGEAMGVVRLLSAVVVLEVELMGELVVETWGKMAGKDW